MIDIERTIATELNIKPWQANAAITLIGEDNTIPFIARYRKEATGGLDDEQLRTLNERLKYLTNLEDRKDQIIASIDKQGKLTDELKAEIENAETLIEVEDLYRPYKTKKRTLASKAKEKGLEPLALTIYAQEIDHPIEEEAEKFITDEVPTVKDALKGAGDIISGMISDNATFRRFIRDVTVRKGKIITSPKDEEVSSEYEMYYEYSEFITDIPEHRVLAINRGEKEGILKVTIEAPIENIKFYLEDEILINFASTPELTRPANFKA